MLDKAEEGDAGSVQPRDSLRAGTASRGCQRRVAPLHHTTDSEPRERAARSRTSQRWRRRDRAATSVAARSRQRRENSAHALGAYLPAASETERTACAAGSERVQKVILAASARRDQLPSGAEARSRAAPSGFCQPWAAHSPADSASERTAARSRQHRRPLTRSTSPFCVVFFAAKCLLFW